MARAVYLLILTIGALATRAQGPLDLIVRTTGDSIHCTITHVRSDRLFYTVLEGGRAKRARIGLGEVALYKRDGFFPVEPGRVVASAEPDAPPKERERGKHEWLFSASYGYSHRTAAVTGNIPQEYRSYMERLRAGRHASGSIHWSAMEHLAIGVMYNGFFGSRNSTTITVTQADGTTRQGAMSDDIRMNWYGLDVLFRPLADKKVSPYGSIGAGYITYLDKATYIEAYTVKANSVAAHLRAGVDINATDKLSLGVQLGWLTGRIKIFKIDRGDQTVEWQLPEPISEGLGRIDLAVVLRFRL